MRNKTNAASVVMAALLGAPHAIAAPPHIVNQPGHQALMVDDAPYLMLGAQVNNSSAWPALLPKVWPLIDRLHANTVEVPIAWEQIEPQEGRFDFSFLDLLLDQAREHHVHLVLLWFGTWKNTAPGYTPAWVKLDNKRFPRVITVKGETFYALSPNQPATLAADTRAFVALMTHLKTADPQNTVLMMQVENETGTYGCVRDYSPAAQKLFDAPVPAVLTARLGVKSGAWRQVFGADADEFFAAWSIARYVDAVAAAGKAVKPLPMYVNAALADPFHKPDPLKMTSGGPTHDVIEVWKAAAPHIDVLAPDIYRSDHATYMKYLDLYGRPDNPLLVPETGNAKEFARFFFPVVGRRGIGFSPFGMDLTNYFNFPLGAARLDDETIGAFAANYRLFAPMARVWAKLAYNGKTWGVAEPTAPEANHQEVLALDGKRWNATVSFGRNQFGNAPPSGNPTPSGGVAIAQLAPNEYLVTGFHARVAFGLAAAAAGEKMIFDRVEEGRYDEAGDWIFERVWNGDQTDYGLNFTGEPQVLKVRLATYR